MTRILLCALATQPSTIAGSAFNHKCAWCGRRVMISPSGQRRLVEFSDIKITCMECGNGINPSVELYELSGAGSGGYNTQQVAAAINGAYANYLAYLQQYNGIKGLTGADGWRCKNSGCSV